MAGFVNRLVRLEKISILQSSPMPSIVNATLQIPLSDIPTPLVFATPRQALSHDLAVYIHVGSTAVSVEHVSFSRVSIFLVSG